MFPPATNPEPVRSAGATCSAGWTSSATRVGSAANTAPPATPWPAWAGARYSAPDARRRPRRPFQRFRRPAPCTGLADGGMPDRDAYPTRRPDRTEARNNRRRVTMKIGFMGRPMALNLKKAGHDLIVPERKSLAADIRSAAEVVADAKAVASKAEVVILMVPDTPDVETVLFGANGAAEGLRKGSLLIDMSSISPIATKDFARRVNEKGCDYLDAPVSGGEVGAQQASLTIMVGGPDAAFARAKPLFELMGKNITHVGSEN